MATKDSCIVKCSSPTQSTRYNVGTYLAHRLKDLGVREYFAVPGDFNLVLLDQILKNESLRMIGCCNELNAGYAADGYARCSANGVAVVFVTFMVGALSIINAIAGACSERLKVIVICGCPSSNMLGLNSLVHHTIGESDKGEALRMFTEVTTSAVRLTDIRSATAQLDNALIQCIKNSMPVYIEIPKDLSDRPCHPPNLLRIPNSITQSPKDLKAALDAFIHIWKLSKNPIILIGGFTRLHISLDIVSLFVDKLGCTVFCHPDGKSQVDESHPQFGGTFWAIASDPNCYQSVMNSDLWIVVAARWSDYHSVGSSLNLNKEKGRILDLQNNSMGYPDGRRFDGVSLLELINSIIRSDIVPKKDLLSGQKTNQHHFADLNYNDSSPSLKTAAILSGIQSLLKSDDTLIAETGDSWFNAQSIRLPRGADVQMQMMYGSIGWSSPATLGCQLAQPAGRAILMIGDGSFQMTAQELSTMIDSRSTQLCSYSIT